MIREGKVEPVASPDTPAMSDQRDYLFPRSRRPHLCRPAGARELGGRRARGPAQERPAWYASDHGIPDESIQRDDPAATTVELPPGTTPAQVAAIEAVAVPVGVPATTASP